VVSTTGTLYAVDTTGRVEWSFSAPGPLNRNFSPPAIGEDGTVYFGSQDHHLYSIAPDGTERWRFRTDGPVQAPSIGVDGTLYVASDRIVVATPTQFTVLVDAKLHAVAPGGEGIWSVVLEDDVQTGPAIDFDGTILIGMPNWIYGVAPDGSLLWKQPSGTFHTPILGGDGSIYVGQGRLYVLDQDRALKWEFSARDGPVGVPAIGLDGTIHTGRYAFTELGASNGGFANAPWPLPRGDRANTGRAPGGE
jgi:outer membrane protein assembly factor BamB